MLTFANTDVVIPIATKKEDGKFENHTYRITQLSDFPELGVSIEYGVATTLTPEKPKPGYKTKGIKDILYRQLLQIKFNNRLQPAYTLNGLLSEHISPDDTVYVYEDGKRVAQQHVNHLAIIDAYVIPKAMQMMLSKDYKAAQFSSWLHVGLGLMSLVHNDTLPVGENSFNIVVKSITQDQLHSTIINSVKELETAKAYVSDSHKLIATKLPQLQAAK